MTVAPCGTRYPHEGPCCVEDDCPNGQTHHGYCKWHWQKQPLEVRFWSQVNKAGDCWEWTGSLRRGYGRFKTGRTSVTAHRFSYEHMVGPIPEGLELDHLCRNTACVRPDHLEPVTRLVNVRRSLPHRPDVPARPRSSRRVATLYRLAEVWPDRTMTADEARTWILSLADNPAKDWWR